MTKTTKHITAQNAEKSTSQTKTEISEAEKLIAETRITPELTTPTPEKPRRGRPPKKPKPTWNVEAYRKNPIAETINKTLCVILNKTITKNNNIEPNEIQLGEAITYTLDYYLENIPVTHPIFVLIVISIATVIKIAEKTMVRRTEIMGKPLPELPEKPVEVK